MPVKKKIQIYDTTLRDGSQSEEITYTVEDKLNIAQKLDWLGVDYIEAGWPGASPKDTEFFQRAGKELKLKTSKLAAFGSTRKASNEARHDKVLNDLLESGAKTLCIFGKTWDLHVKTALDIPLSENLRLIEDSIAFLKKNKRQVFFDAEHFFDGYKANKKYALESLRAAKKGGVDIIVLCDTNGGTLPHEISKIVKEVRSTLKVPLGIHCHNDTGVAVANSLAAVQEGAIQVQGTMNGIGERCGNANLCTIMANMVLKMGLPSLPLKKLTYLTEVSRFIDELGNRTHNRQQPYVGKSAFAHKGGVHVNAILKSPKTYEHISPAKVGNEQRILVSDLSGMATLSFKIQQIKPGLKNDDPRLKEILSSLKNMENRGYQFEGAEASFEIFVKKALGLYKPHFKLHDFKVTDRIHENGDVMVSSEAEIHLAVDGHEEKAAAKGVGPVHAIDQALRRALERFYPCISTLKLVDYKVRVLPAGNTGTASYVRVLIEFGDGEKKWSTVGVSENIIQASFQALVDGIDYKILNERS